MLFAPAAATAYPVRLEADYPERLSRLSTLFRIVLAIPVLLLLYFVAWGVQGGLTFGHWIAVLVRGRPVGWLFDAIVAVQRLTLRGSAYFLLLDDRYPPFDGDWPVRYEVDRPGRLSRWQLVFWKTAVVIPHLVVLAFVLIGVAVAVAIAWFAILFSGRYPRGLHTFVGGWLRWSARVNAYWVSLTDEFPSFSLSAEVGPAYRSSYVISAVFGWLIVAAWSVGIGVLIAWPYNTEEVRVSYRGLQDGVASDPVTVDNVEVVLLSAEDPYEFEEGFYVAEDERRFVLFTLSLTNWQGIDLEVNRDDFYVRDRDGDRDDPFLVSLGGATPPRKLGRGQQGLVALIVAVGADPAEVVYRPPIGFKVQAKFRLE